MTAWRPGPPRHEAPLVVYRANTATPTHQGETNLLGAVVYRALSPEPAPYKTVQVATLAAAPAPSTTALSKEFEHKIIFVPDTKPALPAAASSSPSGEAVAESYVGLALAFSKEIAHQARRSYGPSRNGVMIGENGHFVVNVAFDNKLFCHVHELSLLPPLPPLSKFTNGGALDEWLCLIQKRYATGMSTSLNSIQNALRDAHGATHYCVVHDKNRFDTDDHCSCTVPVVPSSSNIEIAVELDSLQLGSTPRATELVKFQVGFVMNRQTIMVDTENEDSVSSVIQQAMLKTSYWPKDVYYTSSMGILDLRKTMKESHLSKGSLIFVNIRNRGGGEPPADCEWILERLLKTDKVPLLDHIRSVKGHDPWIKWFEMIKLPRSLVIPGEWGGVLLHDEASKLARMLTLCLERCHASGHCFGGFSISDVYYLVSYGIIEINAPWINFSSDSYIDDWLSVKEIIDNHYRYAHQATYKQEYPLYLESYVGRISCLRREDPLTGRSWRNRAVLFQNICFESSEKRVEIIEGLVGFFRERHSSDRNMIVDVLDNCAVWKSEVRQVPLMRSALEFAVLNDLNDWVPANQYFEMCGYSYIYFCRCFFVHYTKPGKIDRKELDTAIGIRLPYHLTSAQQRLLVDYELEQVKASSRSSASTKFSVHHIFGHGSIGSDLPAPEKKGKKRKRSLA
uniref:Uncharacterized protein n=1 Tax=Oryza brachyantha TaxID=4533 RepID=J3LNU1_ORYBR